MDDEENSCIRDFEVYLEQEVIVVLRDGRYLYGSMKSFDQFNSIALDQVLERIFHGNKYAEKRHELFLIRGENISMICLGSSHLREELVLEDFHVLSDEVSRSVGELKI